MDKLQLMHDPIYIFITSKVKSITQATCSMSSGPISIGQCGKLHTHPLMWVHLKTVQEKHVTYQPVKAASSSSAAISKYECTATTGLLGLFPHITGNFQWLVHK